MDAVILMPGIITRAIYLTTIETAVVDGRGQSHSRRALTGVNEIEHEDD